MKFAQRRTFTLKTLRFINFGYLECETNFSQKFLRVERSTPPPSSSF